MNSRLVSAIVLAMSAAVITPMSAVAEAPRPVTAAEPSTTMTDEEAANAAVVESLYRAFAAGDGPAIAGILAADIVWMEAEGGPYADMNPYRGPGAVFEGVFGRIGAQWRGFAATPQTIMPSGARVVVLGRYTGTNITTGEGLDAQFVHVFTVSDGKIVAFLQYTDTAQWMDAVTPD